MLYGKSKSAGLAGEAEPAPVTFLLGGALRWLTQAKAFDYAPEPPPPLRMRTACGGASVGASSYVTNATTTTPGAAYCRLICSGTLTGRQYQAWYQVLLNLVGPAEDRGPKFQNGQI